MALIHGGDLAGFVDIYGYEPLDFSTNGNPLGVPEGVKQALCQAAGRVDAYPDPLCRRLRAALAEHEGVQPQQVCCGNGAADLIFRLVQAVKPQRALLTAPSFAEYERALRSSGCQVTRLTLHHEQQFRLTEAILPRLTPDLDLVFLCNPNNPTGHLTEPGLMRQILAACAAAGIVLVVDECFNGFVEAPEEHSVVKQLSTYRQLVVLKAFTKLYGMAGLRLGYCLSGNPAWLRAVQNTGQPWAVSSLAQAAGLAALAEQEYVTAARELIWQEKRRLLRQTADWPVKVLGGDANWLFFRSPCLDLAERIRRRGILIRDCGNFPGLGPGYYRIAVRSQAENQRLIDAMAAELQDWLKQAQTAAT